ncbi:hypothetical protein AAFN85_00710 [Mucilaginibacter sp. CAU 1740]|uniref:hypothetical protein n=1 Tax=Mucilaginibacter sp. CAU 1740 TaxID=3140365 RepID=UPI00325BA567
MRKINQMLINSQEIDYKIDRPEMFSNAEKQLFLKLLIKQNKVRNPTLEKIARCKILGIASFQEDVIAIGAIKPKTKSDFQIAKANIPTLSEKFAWEVGYFYTVPKFEGNRISSGIFDRLLEVYGDGNLMASTEIRRGNRMFQMLLNRQFKQAGSIWNSELSENKLQLFLRH